jgi:TRAP-type mannitol/chloroaromatic compound transport system substrate-binding protein
MEDFMWSDEPITEVDDLKGITVRMMPVMGNVLSENGISVAFISGTEIVASMERGVIDAGEYSIPALDQSFGFQDVAKYVARPGFHQPCATQELCINKQKWEALPDDLKAVVEYACKANVISMMTNVTLRNIASLEFFEQQGITVTYLSDNAIKTLQDWTDAYYEKHATEGTLMKKIVDSQNAFVDKIAEYKDSIDMPYPSWAYSK